MCKWEGSLGVPQRLRQFTCSDKYLQQLSATAWEVYRATERSYGISFFQGWFRTHCLLLLGWWALTCTACSPEFVPFPLPPSTAHCCPLGWGVLGTHPETFVLYLGKLFNEKLFVFFPFPLATGFGIPNSANCVLVPCKSQGNFYSLFLLCQFPLNKSMATSSFLFTHCPSF